VPPDKKPTYRRLEAAPERRQWSEQTWKEVLTHLRETGRIEGADNVILDAPDVRRLLSAAPRKDGRAHFTKVNFSGTQFGDDVDFFQAIFDDARFSQATFGVNTHFTWTNFGGKVYFDYATFRDSAAFVRTEFGACTFFYAQFGALISFHHSRFGSSAMFDNATFGDKACFRDVTFGADASFERATFGDRADFTGSTLERVSFADAIIAGIRLSGVRFSYQASLQGARLFTAKVGSEERPPLLGDVRWNGAQITGVADWDYAKHPRLGEDPAERSIVSMLGESDPLTEPAYRLDAAIRAYRQVSVLLEEQGMNEIAWEFDYRAAELSRRKQGIAAKFASWLLQVTTGYGHRFWRVLITYAAAVTLFGVIYGASGMTSWAKAFPASVLAFHGRGIVSSSLRFTGTPGLVVPAVEAVVGLFVEAAVVAVVIRRMFPR
jgi:uncharacterized protein YjbI with pentapeptide repeats